MFSDMLSYVDVYGSTLSHFLGNLRVSLSQQDFQDLLSAAGCRTCVVLELTTFAAKPKTAMHFGIFALGAMLIQDKDTSKTYANYAQQSLSTLAYPCQSTWGCCM